MSDSETQSYKPTKTAPRRTSVWVWFVGLLIAIGLLTAAVAWAGGVGQMGKLLGVGTASLPSFNSAGSGVSGGSQTTVTTVTAPATSEPASTSPLPAEAQSRMFAEQMESRVAMTDLVQGRISTLSLGIPQVADSSATVPVAATYADGRKMTRTMTFSKYGRTWYFFSLARESGKPSSDAVSPESFDSGVVAAITEQQAAAGTQEMIVKGLLGGGYREAKVDGVQTGPRTATVDVTLTGGSEPKTKGRFVCISKTDAGTTYWFVARFEKR